MAPLSRRVLTFAMSAIVVTGATVSATVVAQSSRSPSPVTAATAGGRAAQLSPLRQVTQQPARDGRTPSPKAVRPGDRGASPGQAAASPAQPRSARATTTSGYAFLFPETADGPVRWNPCVPIHYVTNLSEDPQVRGDVMGAVARLSAVTGLTFVYDGSTTEHAGSQRPVVDQKRYGDSWSPVLIDVATPAQSDLLRPGDDGEGVATWWRTPSSGTQIVTGQMVLRAGSLPTRLLGFGDPDAAGLFLLHELGHVLGLGHVTTPGAVMNHDGALRGRSFSAGDLAGLRMLGAAQGCLPVMRPPTLTRTSVPLSLVH